jgi:hypothetical protein
VGGEGRSPPPPSHAAGSRWGRSLSHIVGTRWEAHFLVLLERLLGAGGKVTFLYCWKPVGRSPSHHSVGEPVDCWEPVERSPVGWSIPLVILGLGNFLIISMLDGGW